MKIYPGFVVGWGTEIQKTCRTNGKGPEVYTKCAKGVMLPNGDAKLQENRGCRTANFPVSKHGLCEKFFHKHTRPVSDFKLLNIFLLFIFS